MREYHRKFPDDDLTEVGSALLPCVALGWLCCPELLLACMRCTLCACQAAACAPQHHITAASQQLAHPPAQAENDEALLAEAPSVAFSGEEAMGRFLDLHELHQAFCNAKFGKQARCWEAAACCE